MATRTWASGENGPQNHADLRKALHALVSKKTGKQLIDSKFTRDHIYAGHNGATEKLAGMLASQRNLGLSTLLVSSMDASAKEEVKNWIDNIPDAMLTYQRGVWTVNTQGSTVQAANSYKWVTVDAEEMKSLNADDRIKKSRKWLKESQKTPKIACQFAGDGTPVIYHLDY